MRILMLILGLALVAPPQATNETVAGTVFKTGTTEPIEGVQVTLAGSPSPRSVLTDKDGHFRFDAIASGRYQLRIQRDGYTAAQTAPVNVAPGQRITGLTLFLTQSGTISGRILDPLGRPAADASVSAAKVTYQDGHQALQVVKSATTNDRGEYRLFWIEPGEYVLRADKTLAAGPARAYFPGTIQSNKAVRVAVLAGGEAARTDFSLQNSHLVKVSGTVVSTIAASTPPAPNPLITNPEDVAREALRARLNAEASAAALAPQFFLSPIDPEGIYDAPTTVANTAINPQDRAAGKFELQNVPPGTYDLIATITDRTVAPVRYYMGLSRIEVGLQDVTGVGIVIAAGVDLTGRANYSSNVSPGTVSPRIQLRPNAMIPSLPPALASALTLSVAADGTFEFSNVPPLEYVVSVSSLPPGTHVSDIRQGNASIFDIGTIAVEKGAPTTIEVDISSGGAVIKGTVSASSRDLPPGVTVTLVPEERRRENASLYRRASVTAGAFSFVDVVPGRYSLFAWEDIPVGAERSVEFMDRHRGDGIEVEVAGGNTSTVQLRLISK